MNKSIAFITLKTSIKTDNTRNRDYRQNTETCATRNRQNVFITYR